MATKKNDVSSDSKKGAQTPAKVIGKKRLPGIKLPGFLRSFFGYFIGAWQEIRQVRWPSRKATWKSTVAVLLFTAFWMVIVLLVDLLFQNILNNILA